jgi:hypothetical protein
MFKRCEHRLHGHLKVDTKQFDCVFDHVSNSLLMFGVRDALELRIKIQIQRG